MPGGIVAEKSSPGTFEQADDSQAK